MTDPRSLNDRGTALAQQGNPAEAERCFRAAIVADAGFEVPWRNLGLCLEDQARFTDAADVYAHAAEKWSAVAAWHFRQAEAYRRANLIPQALAATRHGLALDPNDGAGHGLQTSLLLLAGQFPEGWDAMEKRWQSADYHETRRAYTPFKVGQVDLRGKRVAIYGEQGFGDMLQMARFIPLLAERGADITAVVPVELRGIFGGISGVKKVVVNSMTQPVDYQIPLMSLPWTFDATPSTLPTSTYIPPDPCLVRKWSTRIKPSPNLKVGICWAGRPQHRNDRERSVKLDRFAALTSIPGLELHSLQKGAAAREIRNLPSEIHITDWSPATADFADSAALISQLDLVISVDTSIAHLAGALGKPVWTLLAFAPDWRWMLNRDDSPWYRTIRLFRQGRHGDWDEVFCRIEMELRELAGNRSSPANRVDTSI